MRPITLTLQLLFTLFLFPFFLLQGQQLTLQSESKSTSLESTISRPLTFLLEHPLPEDEINCGSYMIEGFYSHHHDNGISVIRIKEDIQFTNIAGFSERRQRIYPYPSTPFDLQSEKLFAIGYQSKERKAATDIGGTLVALGSLATLFVAPIFSIDYGNGKVNEKVYIPVAATGLSAIGIGIPLLIIGKKKYFHLTENDKEKRVWKIVNP